jgi:hypothetical protein
VGNCVTNKIDVLGDSPLASPYTAQAWTHPNQPLTIGGDLRYQASELGLVPATDEERQKIVEKAEQLDVCDLSDGETADSGKITMLVIATNVPLHIGHLSADVSGTFTNHRSNGHCGWSFDGTLDPEDDNPFNFGPNGNHSGLMNAFLFVAQLANPIVSHHVYIDGTIDWTVNHECAE